MKSNKCSNCGANIDLKTMSCPYCKSTYAQPTEAKKQTSGFFSMLNSMANDLSKALKPLDDAIKPVYDEISQGIKNGPTEVKKNDDK